MVRSRLPRLSLATAALFVASASAQSLIASTLPACAQQCSLLTQASTSCMSNPAAAQSCFCESALLAVIKTNPTANQCTVCSAADWTTIANWYNGQCANGGATAAVSVSSSAAAAAPQTTLIVVTSTSAGAGIQEAAATTAAAAAASTYPASADASNADNNVADYTNGQEWFQGHWRWIVMLIVLLIAAIVAGVLGSILYKRHKRRKNLGSHSGSAGNWGPNSSAHDFDTQGRVALANAGPVTEEKTPRSERKAERKGSRLNKIRGK